MKFPPSIFQNPVRSLDIMEGLFLKRILWAFVPATIIIVDLFLRPELDIGAESHPLLFLGGLFVSGIFWVSFVYLIRGTVYRWAIFLCVPLISFLIFISWGAIYLRSFAVSSNEVKMFFDEPIHGFYQILHSFGIYSSIIWLLMTAFWVAVLWFSSDQEGTKKTRLISVGGLGACVIFLGCIPSPSKLILAPFFSDIKTATIFLDAIKNESPSLETTRHLVEESTNKIDQNAPSFLFIVGESFRLDHSSAFSHYKRKTSPFLAAFLREHEEESFVFHRHVPNSAGTFWALGGLFLGRYPKMDSQFTFTQPAIWQYASSIGYHTFIVSVQAWSTYHFREFWLSPGPDQFFDATKLSQNLVNDVGADDMKIAHWFAERYRMGTFPRPFFGIFQTNSTHVPFLPSKNATWEIKTEVDRYDAAILHTDEAIGEILTQLKNSGDLEDTIIIFTTDHAEALNEEFIKSEIEDVQKRAPEIFLGIRTNSCEPVYINAPLMIYIPQKYHHQFEIHNLSKNANKVSSHIDILPTVLAMMKINQPESVRGKSLLSPLPEERVAFCFSELLSNTGARQGNNYLLESQYGKYFYDLSQADTDNRRWLPKRPFWSDAFEQHVDAQRPF